MFLLFFFKKSTILFNFYLILIIEFYLIIFICLIE